MRANHLPPKTFSAKVSRRQILVAGGRGRPGHAACISCRSQRALAITETRFFKIVLPMQDDIINGPECSPDDLREFPKIPQFILKVHGDSGIEWIGETERGALEDRIRRSSVWYLAAAGMPDWRGSAHELGVVDAAMAPSCAAAAHCTLPSDTLQRMASQPVKPLDSHDSYHHAGPRRTGYRAGRRCAALIPLRLNR